MKQIIVAPSLEIPKNPTVFLGGGITGCDDWQSNVCKLIGDSNDVPIFNPRREKFYNKGLDFIFDATTILRASNKTKTPRARICPHYQGVCGLDEDILCYRYNIYEICDKYKETTECQKK